MTKYEALEGQGIIRVSVAAGRPSSQGKGQCDDFQKYDAYDAEQPEIQRQEGLD